MLVWVYVSGSVVVVGGKEKVSGRRASYTNAKTSTAGLSSISQPNNGT